MDQVITVSRLVKRYGSTTAVDGVSFAVTRGEIFGLLGRNGAGKTTIVECLHGLRRADSGHLRVLGLDPRTQARELRRRVGCQLQESALPHRIRVGEALRWFASFTPHPVDWRRLAGQWGLADKLDCAFAALSGGQRQRLFVALALVNDPEVVFLDEMTTGLDPAARHVAWDLIRSIRDRGVTVVLVTHFMDEAERLCDRLAVVDAGRIVALDTPGNLVAAHSPEVTVRFSAPPDETAWIERLAGVSGVERHREAVWVRGRGAVLVDVAAGLAARGQRPADLRVDLPTLEEVFLEITGHALEE